LNRPNTVRDERLRTDYLGKNGEIQYASAQPGDFTAAA
jgi:hypothetical protein